MQPVGRHQHHAVATHHAHTHVHRSATQPSAPRASTLQPTSVTGDAVVSGAPAQEVAPGQGKAGKFPGKPMPGAPGVVVERACLPRVTFAGTQTVHSRPQVVHAPQDQVIRLQGGDTVIPYDVSLPPRVFDVHPGGITVTTEHNVVIQPRVTVPADEINIHPVQIRDERGGVTVAEATVELACEEGGGKPQPIVGKPAIAPHKGGMAPAHPGAIVGGAASSSSQDEPV